MNEAKLVGEKMILHQENMKLYAEIAELIKERDSLLERNKALGKMCQNYSMRELDNLRVEVPMLRDRNKELEQALATEKKQHENAGEEFTKEISDTKRIVEEETLKRASECLFQRDVINLPRIYK